MLERYNLHVCSYLRHKYKLLILSRLSNFMTCCERFNIFSEGYLSQHCRKTKFGVYVNQTLIYTNCYA